VAPIRRESGVLTDVYQPVCADHSPRPLKASGPATRSGRDHSLAITVCPVESSEECPRTRRPGPAVPERHRGGTPYGIRTRVTRTVTSAGQALWGRVTQFFAGSLLGALILGRKRDRCKHCNKPLTDQEGILVNKDDSYDCADNPDGDHHQLKRK